MKNVVSPTVGKRAREGCLKQCTNNEIWKQMLPEKTKALFIETKYFQRILNSIINNNIKKKINPSLNAFKVVFFK